MATTRSDTILPSLLDRLTDQAPSSPYGSLFVSSTRYLETVRRDLSWLLKTMTQRPSDVLLTNCPAPARRSGANDFEEVPPASLGDFAQASASVLAFGVPWARGEMVANSNGLELGKLLEQAIRAFEPRLDPATLRVKVVSQPAVQEEEASVAVITVEIEGRVRIKAAPDHLLLKACYTPAFAQWQIEGISNGP